MAHESSLDPMLAVKGLFKGKDDEHPVHKPPHLVDTIFLPRPELRAHKVDDRNAQLMQRTSQREVYIGKIDQNGRAGSLFGNTGLKLPVLGIDPRDVPDNLRNPHHGYILSAD